MVRDTLAGRVLTREELVAEIASRPGVEHLADELRSGWGTLLKPLAWQGDLVVGPSRGNRVTFMRPEEASSRWAGVPPADEAAPAVIAAYLRAYAPARIETFGDWLAGGWFGKRQLRGWFSMLGDRLAEVHLDGEPYYVLADDVDELASTPPTSAVRLLPGFDQYVLGPGTGDGRVTPAARRSAVSRQAGWISPVVVAGGVVRGTWELDGDVIRLAWFEEAGRPPTSALRVEVERLASIVARPLELAVSVHPL